MPTTTPKGWPIPLGGDSPDVPGAFSALGYAMDNQLPKMMAAGLATVTFAGQTNLTLAVTFPTPFVGAVPLIFLTLNNPAQTSITYWRALSIGLNGFTIGVAGTATTGAIPVAWQALQMA